MLKIGKFSLTSVLLFFLIIYQEVLSTFDVQKHPFMALVAFKEKNQWKYFSGVIISDQWILTTANALQRVLKIPSSKILVYVGNFDLKKSQPFYVETLHQNTLYDPKMRPVPYNNLALIKLKTTIPFSDKVQPIALAQYADSNDEGHEVVAFGYDSDGQVVSRKFQTISDYDCENLFRAVTHSSHFTVYAPQVICANATVPGANVCHGHVGGPLVDATHGVVTALVATAEPDCIDHTTYPSIFYKVSDSNYTKVILKNTGKTIQALDAFDDN